MPQRRSCVMIIKISRNDRRRPEGDDEMLYRYNRNPWKACRRCAVFLCALIILLPILTAGAFAEKIESATVRVGYYENEVFQEGAEEGAIKTGYAYEYYRKISEYTGWNYEYVYG